MACTFAWRARLLVSTAAAVLAGAAGAQAQEAVEALPTITVQAPAQQAPAPAGEGADSDGNVQQESAWGTVDGYIASRTATGIKTDTPLKEIPQSVSVVTREEMDDQGVTTVQQALRYVPGVYAGAYGLDSRGDWARIRGADPEQYLDGMRQIYGYYNNTRPDPYMLERVEVLKGPASVLYGQGSTAGILSLISKRPQEEAHREIGVQYGSFDHKQVQADFTGKLTPDGEWLYRLVGVARDAETQTDFVEDDRIAIAPSITWRPSADTTLTLLGHYQKDEGGSTTAFLPWEGTLYAGPNGKLPWSRFVSEPDFDAYNTESASITALFETRLNEVWTFRQGARYTESSVDYRSLYPLIHPLLNTPQDPFVDPERRKIARAIYVRNPDAQVLTSDSNLEAKFDTGPLSHKLLVGLDYSRFAQQSESGFGTVGTPLDTDPPFDLYDPVYGNYTAPMLAKDADIAQHHRGLYMQDQIKLGRWIAVLGVRRDKVTDKTEGAEDQESGATTHRAGLMYEFANGLTPYVSYAESFLPVAGRDRNNQPFDPIRGEQWEIGFKFQPQGRDILINAALYDIVEMNRLTPDPANPLFNVQLGETRTRGGEIEAIASITDTVDIIAGYAYTDAKITEGEGAGFHIAAVPEHQASLWAKHEFSLFGKAGFSVGAGVRYIGESWDGADNLKIPSYTLYDAMIGYETETWRFQVNGSNLEDKKYVASCLSRGDCFLGEGRTILSSLTYKF